MTNNHAKIYSRAIVTVGVAAVVALLGLSAAGAAEASSVLNGPIALGTASTYGVLSGSALTNTGTTTVVGAIGVDPGSAITGFGGAPAGSFSGAKNDDNSAALQAKHDLTTAYNDAAGLTPQTSGLTELSGMSLVPGVYSGGALILSNNGTLTLAGTSASSIWVFQASSSLTIGSATHIVITGGASACNVFWQVGTSASLGTTAAFQGTILAAQSITATTGATVTGRLLASSGDVTLGSNSITVPVGCGAGNRPDTSPTITSGAPPRATVHTPYSFRVTSSGNPTPTFSVTNGVLPAGTSLNTSTGVISGTPTSIGTATFTISAGNGVGVNDTARYTLTTTQVLATTGVDAAPPLELGGALLLVGTVLLLVRRRLVRIMVRTRSD